MSNKQYISLTDVSFPSTTELERDVIAGVASFKSMYTDGDVTEDMFTSPQTLKMWKILSQMYEEGVEVNDDTFPRRLDEEEDRKDMWVRMFDHKGILQAKADINELKTYTIRRKVYYGAAELISNVVKGGMPGEDIYCKVVDFSQGITDDFIVKKDTTLPEEFNSLAESLQELASTGRSNRITTGYDELDTAFIGGFAPGQLVILAARPSAGKTAMMLQLALNAARDGRRVQIYSLEMTARELAERYLLSVDALTPNGLASGNVDWNLFEERSKFFDNLSISIDDRTRNLKEITASVQMKARKKDCDIAFIDYLGYIVTDDSKQTLYQRLGEVTGSLKATARKAGIPIVLLCQLNRETAKDKRPPELYDLRDSGSIEQDADIVMMLQREIISDETDSRLHMYIRKNRRGRMEAHFLFTPDPTYTSFKCEGTLGL